MKNFFLSLLNFIRYAKLKNKKENYIFYSESKFYREHFADLIDNFIKSQENNIIFVTSDYDDHIYHQKKITSFYIAEGLILHLFFQYLKCKYMIMTLTDLGNHLKKSKNCKNYVYFFHSQSSTHEQYTSEAFINYDIVFTIGNYQKRELIEAEKKFGYPPKKIINTGYFFFDHILKKVNFNKKKNDHILFAPSWNYNKNFFDDYGLEVIKKLIENNFFVTLRPHPEHHKRSKKTLSKIINSLKKNSNFSIDYEYSNLHSLEKSELLITDNSSIDMEYVLIFKRPVIHIDYVKKIHNFSSNKISLDTIENHFKNEFGNKIHINQMNELVSLCNKLVNNQDNIDQKVRSFTDQYFSNLGTSSQFAAKYLLSN